MKSYEKVHQLGQSLWYDNIQRRMLRNGEMAEMINRGEIFGVTSNPSIFQNAIAKSTDYDGALKPMAWAGWGASDIFWELAIEDIRATADLFHQLYTDTGGDDGYVSLEVNPNLAHDAEGTFAEAKRLWNRVNRENLMIKIPATREGVKAIKKAIAAGINVNVTLIFSSQRYQEVMDAYMAGLEERLALKKPVESIASVASFFVSRVDSKVDAALQQLIETDSIRAESARNLLGKIAIANGKLAYELFKEKFTSARFEKLQAAGARVQRPLWASTSTKNPAYRDVVYIEELIGPDSVNTVPPKTLVAFAEHGKAEITIDKGLDAARSQMKSLQSLGISIDQVTQELEDEGVKAFSDAFAVLIASIQEKAEKAVAELGPLQAAVVKEAKKLDEIRTMKRVFDVDPTLWTTDPAGQAEIKKRCNWLNAPWQNIEEMDEIVKLRKHCQNSGITHALLLGMGGSSLAPEVMRMIHGVIEQDGWMSLDLAILDSTDPAQVKAAFDRSPVEKTLYLVSSKSGGTAEVNAYFDFFWAKCVEKLGKKAGDHFIAITDPATNLEKTAAEKGFWHVFKADPMVGGRNSALTLFGLVPAALIGMDLELMLKNARDLAGQCVPEVPYGANPGAMLGAIMGAAWLAGRDKLTILTDVGWNSYGSWLEQLVAESSGKMGKGIVPLAKEPEVGVKEYSKDRLFVYLRSDGSKDSFVSGLRENKQPVIEFAVSSSYDLGGQFYLWEVATAVACITLGVNSFDQPDVQDNKNRTVSKIAEFRQNGKLSEKAFAFKVGKTKVFTAEGVQLKAVDSVYSVVDQFLSAVIKPGDYIAINAYVPRNEHNEEILTQFRRNILLQFKTATTLGFGPRFLHSTGQLHKGGANNGVFIQITAEPLEDMPIPEEGISFGTLERAQSIGDFEALEARGRRLIRIHLPKPELDSLLK